MNREQTIALFANILSDTDLDHLKIRDVRNMIGHFESFIEYNEEGEEDEEVDINRYVL